LVLGGRTGYGLLRDHGVVLIQRCPCFLEVGIRTGSLALQLAAKMELSRHETEEETNDRHDDEQGPQSETGRANPCGF
jgi:hypothetical protein